MTMNGMKYAVFSTHSGCRNTIGLTASGRVSQTKTETNITAQNENNWL